MQQQLDYPASVTRRPHSAPPIILSWDVLWIVVLGTVLYTLISLDLHEGFTGIVRLLLGLGFALIVPGYCLTIMLLPWRKDMDMMTRMAFSVGGSAAALILLTLVLHLFSLPLTFELMMPALVLWIGGTSLVALIHRLARPQPAHEHHVPVFKLPHWMDTLFGKYKSLVAAGLVLLVVVDLFAIYTFLITSVDALDVTEFYILGEEGFAERYPRAVTQGEDLEVTMGIANRQHDTHSYRLEVWAVDSWDRDQRELVAQRDDITLESGQVQEWTLQWQMPWVGTDQRVEFLLFVDGDSEPYRTLHLTLDEVTAGDV